MTLLDLMDALQVHAKAAAVAIDTKFYDVAVGFVPVSKGRCVRIFYAGERETEHMPFESSLTSDLLAQAIGVRGYWIVSDTGVNRQRAIEGEMAVFARDFRVRVSGDKQLGGASVDLKMYPAVADQITLGAGGGVAFGMGTQYAVLDIEIVVDFDEFTVAK